MGPIKKMFLFVFLAICLTSTSYGSIDYQYGNHLDEMSEAELEEVCGILCSPYVHEGLLFKSLKGYIEDLNLKVDQLDIEERNDDHVIVRLKDGVDEAEIYNSMLVDVTVYKDTEIKRTIVKKDDNTSIMYLEGKPSTSVYADFAWFIPGTPSDMYAHRVILTFDQNEKVKHVKLIGRKDVNDPEDSYTYERKM